MISTMMTEVVKMDRSLEMFLMVLVYSLLNYKCQLGGVGPRETGPNRPIWLGL